MNRLTLQIKRWEARDIKLLYVFREVAALSCFEKPENTRKKKLAHAAVVAARRYFPI